MKPYRLYILDLDGTLYRGKDVVPGSVETVRELRRRGAMIRYMTNNSAKTPSEYALRLQGLGFDAEPSEIASSSTATARWLKEHGYESAFVVGESGLFAALTDAGIRHANGGPSHIASTQADCVVVGICRQFTYPWLCTAMQHILEGARFIATNADATYPVENGKLNPGAGSIVAAIQACTGEEPYVVGKPNPYVIELLLGETGVKPEETLVVGDRMETDIVCGRRAGCDTHLVLTGVAVEAPEGQSWSFDLTGLVR
ncbi:MAG: HAD-IIA family hydrolase [Fimbriimonadaceae bacterium]